MSNQRRILVGTMNVNRGAEYTPEEVEWLTAVRRYKETRRRPFPTWREVRDLFLSLGYRQVARRAAMPAPPPDEGGRGASTTTKGDPRTIRGSGKSDRQRAEGGGGMIGDLTEAVRRAMVAEINGDPGGRAALEARHGRVWDTGQLGEEFEVLGFTAPLVVVRRREDGARGSLEFQHDPRFYFGWRSHEGR